MHGKAVANRIICKSALASQDNWEGRELAANYVHDNACIYIAISVCIIAHV